MAQGMPHEAPERTGWQGTDQYRVGMLCGAHAMAADTCVCVCGVGQGRLTSCPPPSAVTSTKGRSKHRVTRSFPPKNRWSKFYTYMYVIYGRGIARGWGRSTACALPGGWTRSRRLWWCWTRCRVWTRCSACVVPSSRPVRPCRSSDQRVHTQTNTIDRQQSLLPPLLLAFPFDAPLLLLCVSLCLIILARAPHPRPPPLTPSPRKWALDRPTLAPPTSTNPSDPYFAR